MRICGPSLTTLCVRCFLNPALGPFLQKAIREALKDITIVADGRSCIPPVAATGPGPVPPGPLAPQRPSGAPGASAAAAPRRPHRVLVAAAAAGGTGPAAGVGAGAGPSSGGKGAPGGDPTADFDKYVDDAEVRAALAAARQRVSKLEEQLRATGVVWCGVWRRGCVALLLLG